MAAGDDPALTAIAIGGYATLKKSLTLWGKY